ncbi:MAG TPA: M23 family metallopeptidase [Dietzia timorensis]|uniref:M23 family metallopeptidase n=1 Tax=Dietzia timorensis TaxID=499555 RepID=A0A921K0F7_9ACTN|nr:M23 family metallopeptidase [Dietzia timorensis]HJE92076.1 M23 family metallopeptidase [Dietzia timorensis]
MSALAVFVFSVILTILVPRILPKHAVRVVKSPVEGRWLGMNSPATKVPSHGVRAYGQTYAIDLVFEPADSARPTFGGTLMRPAGSYPAFGQPVRAMVNGVVVKASDSKRDHRARSSLLSIAYLMIEGVVREIGGPGFIVGNHVTIRTDEGSFATLAHLQRDSVTVKRGDQVREGTHIGNCGNSGNSSEPHVHAQLADRPNLWTAIGLPVAFASIELDDDPTAVDGLPANNQHMIAHALT